MVGTAQARLCPPYEARIVLTSSHNKWEKVDGHAKANLKGCGSHHRAEKITSAKDCRQVHVTQTAQGHAGRKTAAAEAAHRHQPLSRPGFCAQWFARLRALPRSRHCGCDRWIGAGACHPADRAVQSGGSLK